MTSAIRAETTTAAAGRARRSRALRAVRALATTNEIAAPEERRNGTGAAPEDDGRLARLTHRVRGEYAEMPGLRLTVPQAARLFSLAPDVAELVLDALREDAVLHLSPEGTYSLRR